MDGKQKKIILRSELGKGIEQQKAFTTLTKAVEGTGVYYNTIKKESFPIMKNGFRFDKKIVNQVES